MKKLLFVCLSILVLAGCRKYPNAYEIWYTTIDGEKVSINEELAYDNEVISHKYMGKMGIITFKEPVYDITTIFQDKERIKTITLPDHITTIPEYAFNGFSSLTHITLPESLTDIGDDAFAGCNNLISINIPEGVEKIRSCTFHWCTSLKDVTIPSSVKEIEYLAFGQCQSLQSITIPEGVETIRQEAFRGTALENITIPESMVDIEYNAFYTGSMKGFHGKFASADNRCIIIDGTLIEVAMNGLTSYTIPEGVKRIGEHAFDSCPIESITIPKGVISIGDMAFYGCKNLRRVMIHNSIRGIHEDAFHYCSPDLKCTLYDDMGAAGHQLYRVQDMYRICSERHLTSNDIAHFTKEKLRIIRNQIYAKHGMIFRSSDLNEYFYQCDWYTPMYYNVSDMLSDIEFDNVKFILSHE